MPSYTKSPVEAPQLCVSGYSNNGDSFQRLITKPLHHDGVYQVFEAAASHGYADTPKLHHIAAGKLPEAIKEIRDKIKLTMCSRDPHVEISGTGEFGPTAAKLTALVQSQEQSV